MTFCRQTSGRPRGHDPFQVLWPSGRRHRRIQRCVWPQRPLLLPENTALRTAPLPESRLHRSGPICDSLCIRRGDGPDFSLAPAGATTPRPTPPTSFRAPPAWTGAAEASFAMRAPMSPGQGPQVPEYKAQTASTYLRWDRRIRSRPGGVRCVAGIGRSLECVTVKGTSPVEVLAGGRWQRPGTHRKVPRYIARTR